jgi:DNA topoisomerase-1
MTTDLLYVSDLDEGLRRVGKGTRTRYLDASGRAVTEEATLARIRSLAIPPAWRDVWICAHAQGHLQAVGRDARGRKQYRYHADWRRRRDAEKHRRALLLARRLPRIREAAERDLRRQGMPREKVLALVVRLLELTHLRVGNREYERLNGTFGLTTLRDRHAHVRGDRVRFRFRAKSGKVHEVGIRDRRLARLIRRIQELRGQRLFEYLDEEGTRREVRSEDVNAYLREVSGADITAKDLRTWAGTVMAFRALRAAPPGERDVENRRTVARAVVKVSESLGNTPAVTRASYVDPAIIDAWESGAVARVRGVAPDADVAPGPPTPDEEAAVRRVLERQARLERRQSARRRGGRSGRWRR